MSNSYQRMTLSEREELSIHYAQGMTLRAIARQLNRAPSTISRELARNRTGFYYRAVTAERKARQRYYRKPRCLAVDARLCQDHPHDPSLQVCAETIYSYLYVLPRGELRRELLSHLRRPRSRVRDRRGQIPDMVSIDVRPAEVAYWTIPG